MRSFSSFNPAIVMLKRSGVYLVNPGPKQQSKKFTGIKIIEASSDETLENIHRLSKHDQWLAHFNCRSLMAIDELRLTFQDLHPLFIGITETWLDIALYQMLRLKYRDFPHSVLIGKTIPAEEVSHYIYPRANGAKRRARVLIPHGYLHPGKGKHSEV